jgi:glycolate oxidase FAD binding subunit
MNQLAGKTGPLSGAAWVAGRMYVRYSGTADAVAAACKSHEGDTVDGAIWDRLRERSLAAFEADSQWPLWRVSAAATSAVLTDAADTVIDWCGAQRFIRSAQTFEAMTAMASAAGGYAMRLSHNDAGSAFVQEPAAAVRALHQRLKAAFDPARIFNPGRLYAWL